jgi:hypothetical protein
MAVTADKCELWANGKWQVVGIDDVVEKWSERRIRCIECHGAVRAHRQGSDGHPAHFEHTSAHSGCSLCPGHWDGNQRPHPKKLT